MKPTWQRHSSPFELAVQLAALQVMVGYPDCCRFAAAAGSPAVAEPGRQQAQGLVLLQPALPSQE
jgi:hypothetical protein